MVMPDPVEKIILTGTHDKDLTGMSNKVEIIVLGTVIAGMSNKVKIMVMETVIIESLLMTI